MKVLLKIISYLAFCALLFVFYKFFGLALNDWKFWIVAFILLVYRAATYIEGTEFMKQYFINMLDELKEVGSDDIDEKRK